MRSTMARLALAAAVAQTPDLELTAVPRDNPTEARVDIELTNTSSKTAVAWALRVYTETGGPTTRTSDVAMSLISEHLPTRVLQPHPRRTSSRLSSGMLVPAW